MRESLYRDFHSTSNAIIIFEVQDGKICSKENTAGQTSQIGKMTAWGFEELIDATVRVKCVLF
jgi:hypothetical protein